MTLKLCLQQFLLFQISILLHAVGMGEKAAPGIVRPVLGISRHALHDLRDDTAFGADLLPCHQLPLSVHMQQRADPQQAAECACRRRDPSAPYVGTEVSGEKPVLSGETMPPRCSKCGSPLIEKDGQIKCIVCNKKKEQSK